MTQPLQALARRVGHTFADEALLATAMRHRSWISEHDGFESNERLEFLGDAIVGWVVADIVYTQHSNLPEGKLTDLRKSVVNAIALAEMAVDLDIGSCIMLGKGEAAAGGNEKTSILSDAFEAVIGAVYLDAGPTVAHSDGAAHRRRGWRAGSVGCKDTVARACFQVVRPTRALPSR
jgi:ribonuclease-3